MASESFLAVPTVSNPQETDAVLSLDHMSLLASVEGMSGGGEHETFNLDTLRAINEVISASSGMNNDAAGSNVDNTSSEAMRQGTKLKKVRNSPCKNVKKASQEVSLINLQPTQSSFVDSMPSQDNQHPNGPYFSNQPTNNIFFYDTILKALLLITFQYNTTGYVTYNTTYYVTYNTTNYITLQNN